MKNAFFTQKKNRVNIHTHTEICINMCVCVYTKIIQWYSFLITAILLKSKTTALTSTGILPYFFSQSQRLEKVCEVSVRWHCRELWQRCMSSCRTAPKLGLPFRCHLHVPGRAEPWMPAAIFPTDASRWCSVPSPASPGKSSFTRLLTLKTLSPHRHHLILPFGIELSVSLATKPIGSKYV